jgi:hypothetical protein
MKKTSLYAGPLIMLVILLDPVISQAGDDILGDGLGNDFKFYAKEWKEAKVTVPALPKDDDLLFFKVYNSRFKHYVDARSLNFKGGDNVARYTVVVVSPSGTRNIMFEGIRCDTQRYKSYAYSINGEPFQPLRGQQWNDIRPEGSDAFRFDLFRHYFCENSILRGKEKDIINLIKTSPDNSSNADED